MHKDKVVWRSTCRDSGEQCAVMALIQRMLPLPAGNWDTPLFLLKALLVHWGKAFEVCKAVNVCHGFSYAPSSFPQASSTVPIWLDEVECSILATTLLSCSSRGIGIHNCFHSDDQALRCSGPTTTSPPSCTLPASAVEPPSNEQLPQDTVQRTRQPPYKGQ